MFIRLTVATLCGGALGSFGINAVLRSGPVRSAVKRWQWWVLALYYATVAGTVLVGLAWMVRRVLENPTDTSVLLSPLFFLAFGVLVGLPFSLPTVTSIWQSTRQAGVSTRGAPATKAERRKFAATLEAQLREYVEDSRTVRLRLSGETGDVLVFGGEFTRQEGERLVAALFADLLDVGIRRVEGSSKGTKWWVRVPESDPRRRERTAKRQ